MHTPVRGSISESWKLFAKVATYGDGPVGRLMSSATSHWTWNWVFFGMVMISGEPGKMPYARRCRCWVCNGFPSASKNVKVVRKQSGLGTVMSTVGVSVAVMTRGPPGAKVPGDGEVSLALPTRQKEGN